ncbi:MAG: hypothetical protein B7Z66_03070 [Chromatiales bacterium 21-64-14]|nr:MAG: hypothetical protein B7Z66_03070 [Chromatiales bacterium 21-64-14]HQU15687.1 hypothetical protein [Gammaproteobacteria bacterium]
MKGLPPRIRPLVCVAALAATLTLPVSGAAATRPDAAREIQTATEHAGFAVQADNLNLVHLHLQHAINCLTGPKGPGFDSPAGDPCQGQGNGALTDFTGNAREKRILKQAFRLARTGVHVDQYVPAHDVAEAVQSLLREAQPAPAPAASRK